MSGCNYCVDINTRFDIRNPRDLKRVILIASQNVDDDTIKVVAEPDINQHSFSELSSGKLWGDIVDITFECIHCGQQFELSAETYHGSGGKWAPSK